MLPSRRRTRDQRRCPLSNILAIAQKEIKSYFSSPIAYVVIGFFALMFGFFYYTLLGIFVEQGMRMMGMQGGPTQNVNEQMIRPLFLNASVLLLFVLPMITMRTYSEEKRSGTIELLLTSPLTDVHIIMGKFLGAMALYGAMLAVTLIHVGVLFAFGTPEWIPIATGYLGLLLMGGCFISIGLLISSFTRNQIVAVMATFAVFLLLWVINWAGPLTGPRTQAVLDYLSITNHLDDFTRGIVDTKHLVYYLSFIAFGLFLTARSVDSERWRG
jgi:ABC-2 type transport system permease protein